MKAFKFIAKIIIALAAIAGAVYMLAIYGDKIVQWCKDLLNRLPCKCCCRENDFCEEATDESVVSVTDDGDVVAEEADFE